jgi:lipoprotein-anchoring transpeptidase ErfK/SrfK
MPSPLTAGARLFALALTIAIAFGTSADAKLLKSRRLMPEPEKGDTEIILRLQIHLDESNFGPGKLDGAIGQFTRKAVAHYNFQHGLGHDNYFKVIMDSRAAVKELYTTYTIREEDFKFIADVPFEYEQQADVDYLAYRSVDEFVAERFHTDERFLARINPDVKLRSAEVGTEIKVPNVTPFKIEDVVPTKSYGKDDALSARMAIVDTSQKLVAIWEGDKIIATFPVTPGQEKFIHRGSWTMKNMVTTPEFRYDKSMLKEGKRSEEYFQLPPGPNSPVGIFWAGLSKSGIGLHGTASPHTIGRSKSAGCVRLANWDAIRLSTLIRPGATVEMR